jgi:hypothetical protein
MAATAMMFLTQRERSITANFRISFPLFLILLILMVPGILTVNVAYSASPNVLTEGSSNYEVGYVGNTFASNITYAQASWTVPSLECPVGSATPQSQFLVGFGGWNGGFEYTCSQGVGQYDALYLVDSYYGAIPSGDKVFAGDQMHVSVGVFADVWQILLKDKTQGWEIDNVSEGVSQGNIFFFILGASVPNPNFGEIKVTGACVTAVSSCKSLKYYAKSKDFGLGEYNQTNPSTGDTLASATNLSGKGSSFNIVWDASS